MKRRPAPNPKHSMVRVIPDSRDGSRDYWIAREEAIKLHAEGKLDQDLTNSTPGHPVFMPPLKRGDKK